MKVVLDTNIFISAFFWGGNPQKIIDRIIVGKDRACCKTRLVLHRLLQFFALRAAKLHFLSVAVAKLKFCNSLNILYISNEILNEIANVMSRPQFNTPPAVIKKYRQVTDKNSNRSRIFEDYLRWGL